jgi:hypothetical protein
MTQKGNWQVGLIHEALVLGYHCQQDRKIECGVVQEGCWAQTGQQQQQHHYQVIGS